MTTEEIVAFVIETFEGRLFTDDPVDTGGATKFGITQRTLQYYRRKVSGNSGLIVTKADVRNLTLEEAVACGVQVFAVEPRIAEIADWRLRLVVYDYGFHSGQPRAVRAMQSAAGIPIVDQDGVIGPGTLLALSSDKPALLLPMRVMTDREEFMQDLFDRKPSQRKYMLGWWRRTTKVQRVVVS